MRDFVNNYYVTLWCLSIRLMFWTDWGEMPRIELAYMDGSGRHTIVDTDLSQPIAITVDYATEKVYWSDSDLDKIEYANYDGSERMVLETQNVGLAYPFGLTVAGDVLFWTDWGTNTLYATHKQRGAESSQGYLTEIAVFTSTPYGIEAVDGGRQLPGIIHILINLPTLHMSTMLLMQAMTRVLVLAAVMFVF